MFFNCSLTLFDYFTETARLTSYSTGRLLSVTSLWSDYLQTACATRPVSVWLSPEDTHSAPVTLNIATVTELNIND